MHSPRTTYTFFYCSGSVAVVPTYVITFIFECTFLLVAMTFNCPLFAHQNQHTKNVNVGFFLSKIKPAFRVAYPLLNQYTADEDDNSFNSYTICKILLQDSTCICYVCKLSKILLAWE